MRNSTPSIRLAEGSPDNTPDCDVPIDPSGRHRAIKAAQAISGEIVLSRLLQTLMQTALEHAGAQRGALLVMQETTCG